MRKKFECYEIWRPNIPDNGCNKQCKECKEKQSINFKDMSRDKPTGWADYVAIWCIAILPTNTFRCMEYTRSSFINLQKTRIL